MVGLAIAMAFALAFALAVVLTLPVLFTASARADPLTWTAPELIDPANIATIDAISCPTTSVCLAVDGSGDLVSSVNPTGGAGAGVGPCARARGSLPRAP